MLTTKAIEICETETKKAEKTAKDRVSYGKEMFNAEGLFEEVKISILSVSSWLSTAIQVAVLAGLTFLGYKGYEYATKDSSKFFKK